MLEDIKEIERVLNLSYINAVDKEEASNSLKRLKTAIEKYAKEPDYKAMWERRKNHINYLILEYETLYRGKEYFFIKEFLKKESALMQELESKYGIREEE